MYNTLIIASNIKSARRFRNYSQDYLAYKLKISQNAYSKVERGCTKVTLERLNVIAQVLDIQVNQLIGTGDILADVHRIKSIPIISQLFDVIYSLTGMGFIAVARVTEDRWVACAVRDEIGFGLKSGEELKVETTICKDVRFKCEAVVIDHVDSDPNFACHPTPAQYGFQSYISVPIVRRDGVFFGTLCAIDPNPARLNNPGVTGMFRLFADLISFYLESAEHTGEPLNFES